MMEIIPSSLGVWISATTDMDEACSQHNLHMTMPGLEPSQKQ